MSASTEPAPTRGGRFPVPLVHDPRLAAVLARSPTLASIAGDLRLPSLRATHPRFMNDRSELKLATALMDAELERRSARSRERRARLRPVREALARLSDEPRIWAVSWSEVGNQLSQWRAYAGGVGGFSLGLPVGPPQRMAGWQGFVLVPCIYRDALQRLIAAEATASFFDPAAAPADPEAFAEDLLFIGATLEHAGFAEEREWRLILRRPGGAGARGGGYLPRQRFHATPWVLASWVPFWLRDGDADAVPDLRIVAGSAEDAPAIVASARALLDALPGVEGRVEASGIPLRR